MNAVKLQDIIILHKFNESFHANVTMKIDQFQVVSDSLLRS